MDLTIINDKFCSFGDISNATMFQDIDLLCIGIVVMVIYVQLVISKFNWLEARVCEQYNFFDKITHGNRLF